jgi:hypothetical protein
MLLNITAYNTINDVSYIIRNRATDEKSGNKPGEKKYTCPVN